jgi:mannosyltransferase
VNRWALPGLIAAGFGLRLAGMWQSLYADEVFTHDIVTQASGPIDVLHRVHDTSITPPLHYLLAWMAVQLGDPAWTVRLPSLLLGTATIPLIYALAKRTIGSGLVAAGLYAIGPFALFYGTEARAYATLVFIVAASTLALLLAIDTGRRRWWVLYAVLTAAAMYTHYTAIFVLAVQAIWAFRKETVIAMAGAVLLWLPWVPSYLHQKDNPGVEAIGALFPLTPKDFGKALVQLIDGHPFVKLTDLPGVVGVALLAIGVAIALPSVRRPSRRAFLIIALAAATPIGVLLSQAAGQDIYAPRNLIASLPYACVGLGALLERRRIAIAFAAAALVIGAVEFEQPANRRTPWGEVAKYIDSHAAPSDAVVQVDYFGTSDPFGRKPLLRSLQIEIEKPHRTLQQLRFDDAAAWERAARGSRFVYASATGLPGLGNPSPPRPGPHFKLILRRNWDGFAPVSVFVYEVR